MLAQLTERSRGPEANNLPKDTWLEYRQAGLQAQAASFPADVLNHSLKNALNLNWDVFCSSDHTQQQAISEALGKPGSSSHSLNVALSGSPPLSGPQPPGRTLEGLMSAPCPGMVRVPALSKARKCQH